MNKSDVFGSHQEADLVTTHELGHNFGAEHDPDNIPYCAPSDDHGGKFVMYPIAVSGDHVNNKVPTLSVNKNKMLFKLNMGYHRSITIQSALMCR